MSAGNRAVDKLIDFYMTELNSDEFFEKLERQEHPERFGLKCQKCGTPPSRKGMTYCIKCGGRIEMKDNAIERRGTNSTGPK